jgi:hypothetical protein
VVAGGALGGLGYAGEEQDRKKGKADEAPPPPPPVGAKDGEEAPTQQVRQWFPEAFLWQPLVETDATGKATLDVRVPDQLTTWRVLALAHDRQGRQAGSVTTFDSRLPLYADPVIPAWLYAGDVLDLPVQLVNAGDRAVSGSLTVRAEGALSGGGSGPVSLPIGGTDVARIRVVADGAGSGTIRADLSGAEGVGDAVVREIRVIPQGRPMSVERGGTLSGSREFTLHAPEESDPATRALEVRVFAGALSVLGAELDRLEATGVADGAYAYALLGDYGAMTTSMGVDVDAKQLRKLRLLAWQRVVRDARTPDAGVASDLLVGLGSVDGDEMVDGLKPRLVRTLVGGQRGDGTWARQPTAPLQQVLVQTAWAARALPETEAGSRRRAAGALERFSSEIDDPYTAAVVLASGLVSGDRVQILRKIVLDGLVEIRDGAKTVSVPAQVRNAWGLRPSRAEMLAWTSLALGDDPARADLVGELMSHWSGEWGFGASRVDAVALDVVTAALPALQAPLQVVLSVDGAEVSRATVDPKQPRVAAVLTGKPSGADARIELHTEPSAPGLAYAASLHTWVPWSGDEELAGVDVKVTTGRLQVGRSSPVTLEVAAASGSVLVIEQGLAPGVTVDRESAQLPAGATLEVAGDRVRITTPAFGAGDVQVYQIPVQPSLPGTFSTAPLVVRTAGQEVNLKPVGWTVAPEG